jgi:lipopolysaccharide biosynthesis glycosyltransferase
MQRLDAKVYWVNVIVNAINMRGNIELVFGPNNHPNTRCIAIGLSKNMTFALGTLLINLQKLDMTQSTDIVVFHDGISKDQQAIMKSLANCNFIFYRNPFKSVRVKLSRSVRRFTPMVFSKYEGLKLLERYEAVMWLDYDICIRRNLDHLWSSRSNALTILIADNPVGDCFYRPIPSYDMNKRVLQTGLFVLKRGIGDYSQLYNSCLEMTRSLIDDLYLPEQGIFNLIVEKFQIPVQPLDVGIYGAHPTETTDKTYVVHSWGGTKFWNGHLDEDWDRNYSEWQSLGGEVWDSATSKVHLSKRVIYSIYDRIIA